MRILVVEDHQDTAELLVRVLASQGHAAQSIHTADQALRLLAEPHFDLLVCDIGLPGCDGWELLQRVRRQYAINAIAISGYGMPEDLEKSRAAGFAVHLTKPVLLDELTRTIATVAGAAGLAYPAPTPPRGPPHSKG